MIRHNTFLMLAIILIGYVAFALAETPGVWVGTRFEPEQCLKVDEGTFDVKRKLCTITYDIRSDSDSYVVNGRIRFNKKFIPDNVCEVELEILLIDENRVCTKQLNQMTKADKGKVSFAFEAEKTNSQKYVRTYYIIHYK
jgi:hypothetical protein